MSTDQPTPPRIIYLQWHGDAEPSACYDPPCESEVTWCRERIFEHDLKFESVDRIAELERELAAERALADRLANALTECLCGYTYDSDRALAAWKEARRGAD